MSEIPSDGDGTCAATKELLMGHTTVAVECGWSAGHEGIWHTAQETLEEVEGQRVGYVQFWWRDPAAESEQT